MAGRHSVPLLVIHGDRDEEVPIEMARSLASALESTGVECALVEMSAGHFDVVAAEVTNRQIEAFLANQLRPGNVVEN